jgi:organic radical activating enzyme
LQIEDLKRLLDQKIDNIEITGGGEPTLHPEIEKIIELCSNKAPTQMYTNGAFMNQIKNLSDLSYLCISRAHHLDYENKMIMGIDYDVYGLLDESSVKFSLMLCKQGIHDKDSFSDYVEWASNVGASKIVVREIISLDDHQNTDYVSMMDLLESLDLVELSSCKNPTFDCYGIPVEFDCHGSEEDTLVLRVDGTYKNFNGGKIDSNRY